MASQRWDKGGNMYALFKKFLRLFTHKEDSATRLYRGINSHDQMSNEIRTVVTRIMTLVGRDVDADLIVADAFRRFGPWKITAGQFATQELTYEFYPGNHEVIFNLPGNYKKPPERFVRQIRKNLSVLVDGMEEAYPALAMKLDLYFDAADA